MTTTTRRATALALLIAPGLLLAGHLVQHTPTHHDTRSELAAIAAHQGSYQVAALWGFLGLLLMVPALLALARPVWERRPRLALTGLCLSMSGLLALVSLMGSGPVSLAMVRGEAGRSTMVALTDRYESLPLVIVWVLLLVVGWSLGPVVLGFGLWRTGYPWLVPALLVAGLVLSVLDAGRWPLALAFALTWAGMAVVGTRELRGVRPDPDATGVRQDPAGVAS